MMLSDKVTVQFFWRRRMRPKGLNRRFYTTEWIAWHGFNFHVCRVVIP